MIPPLSRLARDLGPTYCVLLPLSAVVASWLVIRLARRTSPGQPPGLYAGLYGVSILLPFWVGVIGMAEGLYHTLLTVPIASPEDLNPVFLLDAIRMSLMPAWVGLLLVAVPFLCAWVFGHSNRLHISLASLLGLVTVVVTILMLFQPERPPRPMVPKTDTERSVLRIAKQFVQNRAPDYAIPIAIYPRVDGNTFVVTYWTPRSELEKLGPRSAVVDLQLKTVEILMRD